MLNPKAPKYQGIYYGPEGMELTATLLTYGKCRFNCLMCAYNNTGSDQITDEDVIDQVKTILANYKHKIPEIDFFSFGNDGSILDEKSLKFETLLHICELIRRYFSKISFETSVKFITQEKIEQIKTILGDKLFEFAVGLETRDDHIRNDVLRKGLDIDSFEEKIRLIAKNNIAAKVFIILKPSPYMSEKEGIEDCVKTIEYLHELGEKSRCRITINMLALHVLKNSEFEAIAKKNIWTPPLFWSVAEVVFRIKKLSVKLYLDLCIDELSLSAIPGNCGSCDTEFKQKLRKFNRHRNVERLISELPSCNCRPDFVTF